MVMTVIKEVFTHRPPDTGGGTACHGEATQGSTRTARRQKEQGEIMGKSLYSGFCGKEQERQGKQV